MGILGRGDWRCEATPGDGVSKEDFDKVAAEEDRVLFPVDPTLLPLPPVEGGSGTAVDLDVLSLL